jgi:hypothetical protein
MTSYETDRRREAKVLAAKNVIQQIQRTISSWPEEEKPSNGRDKRIKTLIKLLRPIRDPKYGLTALALGGVFYPDKFAPDDNINTWYVKASLIREKIRGLIWHVNKKVKPEGLDIVAIKFKDPLLGITEYRWVNAFWDDSLQDVSEGRKDKIKKLSRIALQNNTKFYPCQKRKERE